MVHPAAERGSGSLSPIDGVSITAAAEGFRIHELPSGAGRTGMALRGLCGVGMVFVRCVGGVCRHPAEHVSHDDAAAGARVLIRVIEEIV